MTMYGQPFEIQIRTEEMHRIAEFGIAAHWKYKEGRTEEENTNFENKLTWLREVMEWQGTLKDSQEFLDALKTELYSDELLVFTPRGKVISLPPGATPVDFAYAIHSEVATAARARGSIPRSCPFRRLWKSEMWWRSSLPLTPKDRPGTG